MKMSSLFIAAVALGAATPALAEVPQCEANYQQEGGFLTGRTFRDWASHPDLTVDAAYAKLYAGFVKSGLRIVTTDKQMHVITVEQPTTLDSGVPSTLNYNTIVEPEGKGSRVSVVMRSPPEKALSADAVKKSLCSIANITS